MEVAGSPWPFLVIFLWNLFCDSFMGLFFVLLLGLYPGFDVFSWKFVGS